jgi:MFS family permease
MRARATALFMLAIPMSSVIGTPLSSWLISSGNSIFENFAGWRFMFIIEGVPAVLLGIMCIFYLTDRPRDAKWLSAEERNWLQATMDAEEKSKEETFHYPVRRSLLQPRVWALSFVYFGMVYGLYAMSFFLPDHHLRLPGDLRRRVLDRSRSASSPRSRMSSAPWPCTSGPATATAPANESGTSPSRCSSAEWRSRSPSTCPHRSPR